jgi:hypothetical protein
MLLCYVPTSSSGTITLPAICCCQSSADVPGYGAVPPPAVLMFLATAPDPHLYVLLCCTWHRACPSASPFLLHIRLR